jgi:uncharacterized membrane protein
MALATALIGGFGLVLIAVLTELTTRAAADGDIPVNGLLGIRTAATKRSEAAWRAGHTAALPVLHLTAVAAVVGAAVTFVVALVLGADSNGITTLVLLLAYAVVVLLLLRAAQVANAAARSAG